MRYKILLLGTHYSLIFIKECKAKEIKNHFTTIVFSCLALSPSFSNPQKEEEKEKCRAHLYKPHNVLMKVFMILIHTYTCVCIWKWIKEARKSREEFFNTFIPHLWRYICKCFYSLMKIHWEIYSIIFLTLFYGHYDSMKLWLTLCLSAAWLSNKFRLQLLEFYGDYLIDFFGLFAWLRINLDESKWGTGHFMRECFMEDLMEAFLGSKKDV